ncbi:MAG: choice-of-anchor D domain-containing protein [Pseudomonadota bacterium]|nr:choice-of-anchor D domain-containing protein [Pseudomonadota bacterium]
MIVALTLLGCSTIGRWNEPPSDTGVPGMRIVASPALLDFGTLPVSEAGDASATLTLYNLGDTQETVTGHDEPIGSDAFHIDAAGALTLDPGESMELTVTYHPVTDQSDAAELLIAPSKETVRLAGVATAPVLESEPAEIAPVVLGCDGAGHIAITNAGSDALVLYGASFESDEYAILSMPDRVAPGQTELLELSFTPAGGDLRGTTLLVSSNDPLRPEVGIAVSGLGYEGERVTEFFRYTPSNPTDLLFVVATGGMTQQVDKALEALPGFVDTLRGTNVDYHVAALSGASPCPSSSPGWAELSDTSLQTQVVLERGFAGASGIWDHDLLGLASEAMLSTSSGDCLDGFRRSDADLHVIVVSDGPSAADVALPEAALELVVAAPARLRVSALIPTTIRCGSLAPDYAGVAERHDGDVSDLCDAEWTSAFQAFATVPEGRESVRYALAEAPVPSTIEVLAEGVPFGAWSWDSIVNEVVFDEETVPALGAEITVRYVSAVACTAALPASPPR